MANQNWPAKEIEFGDRRVHVVMLPNDEVGICWYRPAKRGRKEIATSVRLSREAAEVTVMLLSHMLRNYPC